jgi:hypothetical protein
MDTNDEFESSLRDRYAIYVACADDGDGIDSATGEPIKTFDEWLNS